MPDAVTAEGSDAVTTRVIERLEELDDLEPVWDEVGDGADSPMQRYEWIRSCATAFATNGTLRIVVAARGRQPGAIAPLVERRHPFPHLELLGADELDEPVDVVGTDASTLRALSDRLLDLGRPLLLKRLPAQSPLVSALAATCRGRAVMICRDVAGSPSIVLRGTDDPLGQLAAGRRSDLRRIRRRAELMGKVDVRMLAPTVSEAASLLEEALRVEAAGWKGRLGTALTCDAARRAFYVAYAAAAAQRGALRLGFLRIGGRTAAVQLGVVCGGRFWLLKMGYDEEFARCSPGTLLMCEAVRDAWSHGLDSFELLGTPEAWTRMWRPAIRPCVSVRVYVARPRGLAALAIDGATAGLRRLQRAGIVAARPARTARSPDSPGHPRPQMNQLTERQFYEQYAWCLNPVLSVAELFAHFREELARDGRRLAPWQLEECRINLYLFACAIACTADDYAAWRPFNSSRVARLRPRTRYPALATGWLVNALHALPRRGRILAVERWRQRFDDCVDEACRILVDGDEPGSPRWAGLAMTAAGMMDEPLPSELLTRRMRIPEAFRCQDLTHVDLSTFAERFAASRDPRQEVVVVGPRTAGAYFAPLIGSYLARLGWARTSWFSLRPKAGISAAERRRIRALAAIDAHVIVVDDYPASGQTFRLMVELLVAAGIPTSRITLLVPRHPARADWRPDREAWATGADVITLDPADLHKQRLLGPRSVEALLREYHGDAGEPRIRESPETEAINARLAEHYGDGFEVRLKRVYDVELGGPGRPARTRRIVAKSVGWGWLGYHAYFITRRLAGRVPPLIGVRHGLLCSLWLDNGGLDRAAARLPAALGSYVANRVHRLALSEDPCFEPPRYRWTGWDELTHLLRGVYGPYVGRLKTHALTHRLRRYLAPRPIVVDGRMRPAEWISTQAGIRKLDAEHHNFGGGELDVVDPAYDLAAAIMEHSLSHDQVDELLAVYRRQTGDADVVDRLILYELLYGVVIMNRAAEAASLESRREKREEWNRRYLWARRTLGARMSAFLGGLSSGRYDARWTARLFFLDLDGVLDWEWLGFPHTTPSGIAALDLLRANGFSVVLNTGRSVEDVRRYCAIYRLPGGLAEHGSVFVDAVRGAEVRLVHADAAAQLARCRALIAELPGVCLDPAYLHSVRAYRYRGRRTLGLTREEVQALLSRHGLDRLAVLDRAEDTYVVERGIDKAVGMQTAMEYLGVSGERVAAIGDADDDTGMLELAEASYAPRNCAAAVKRLARRGVCRVLRRPLQRGLLAAVRAELRRQSAKSPRDTAAMRPSVAGAASLLVTLLQAAEHGTCRHWLDALLWWTL